MLLWNWLITPFYMLVERSVVEKMLLPVSQAETSQETIVTNTGAVDVLAAEEQSAAGKA
jgi:hypothetical protein